MRACRVSLPFSSETLTWKIGKSFVISSGQHLWRFILHCMYITHWLSYELNCMLLLKSIQYIWHVVTLLTVMVKSDQFTCILSKKKVTLFILEDHKTNSFSWTFWSFKLPHMVFTACGPHWPTLIEVAPLVTLTAHSHETHCCIYHEYLFSVFLVFEVLNLMGIKL